eukprot:366410-Chlamydomonas_euryale.AAC.31
MHQKTFSLHALGRFILADPTPLHNPDNKIGLRGHYRYRSGQRPRPPLLPSVARATARSVRPDRPAKGMHAECGRRSKVVASGIASVTLTATVACKHAQGPGHRRDEDDPSGGR